jgi:transposase
MAMTIVETRTEITGGVDTHLHFHVAAAVDANGGVIDVETFPVGAKHYAELLAWLEAFGPIDKVGVEGTGSYGAGLARHLRRHGVAVVEVDRPNRQVRHRKGKSDHIDAVAAARAALSGSATGLPKHRDGNVEAIRVLQIARRSAVDERIQILNQMRNICFCADDEIRERFEGLSPQGLINEASNLRPRKNSGGVVRYTTLIVLRELGQRARNLRQETVRLNQLLRPLIRETAPELLDVYGVGLDTAAKLLVAAGDNPERLHSEAAWAHLCGVAPVPASSGKTTRHRLNRGGNRQANSALYTVMLTRMQKHQPTRDYIAKRTAEGKTMGETARMLRRYIAREIYKTLPRPA